MRSDCLRRAARALPKSVHSIRLALQETQSEFGKRFGVWPNTISRWEAGRVVPIPGTLIALLRLAATTEQQQGIRAALEAAGIPIEQLSDSRGGNIHPTAVAGSLHNISITPAAEERNA